jgi:hypothetical protein
MQAPRRSQIIYLPALLALLVVVGVALPAGQRARAQAPVIGGCAMQRYSQCPNADFAGKNISEYDLSGAYLFLANMTGATLDGTDLSWAYLNAAVMNGATLNYVNLTGAMLLGVDMSGATLSNITWLYTMCPDGTTSDQDGGTCENNLGAGASRGSGAERPTPTPRPDNGAPGNICPPTNPNCGVAPRDATATPAASDSRSGCTIFDPRCP